MFQGSGNIFYGKWTCKTGCGGCCNHVDAALYQLGEYWQLNIKVVPDNKTCTDILQKWHVPGEGQNQNPIKFSELQFFKADVRRDDKECQKRPVLGGSRDYCATPMFAFEPSENKTKKVLDWFSFISKGLVLLIF